MQKNRKELVKNITLTGVMASLYVVFVILFGDLSFGFSLESMGAGWMGLDV